MNKTRKNNNSVLDFLDTVENKKRREDSFEILNMMEEMTGEKAHMWGNSIVGFGHYPYKTKARKEEEWFKVGFSPRKQHMVIYIMPGFSELTNIMEKLGKYKIGKSCLYINKLKDVNRELLKILIEKSIHFKYGH